MVVCIPDKISFGHHYLHMLTVSVEVIFSMKSQNIVYRYRVHTRQGNVREFYNFHFVSNDEKQKIITRAVFLTFWIQAESLW